MRYPLTTSTSYQMIFVLISTEAGWLSYNIIPMYSEYTLIITLIMRNLSFTSFIITLLANTSIVEGYINHYSRNVAFTTTLNSIPRRRIYATATTRTYIKSSVSNIEDTKTTTKTTTSETEYSFIQNELRGAAMRLHTKEQSPKEGTVAVPEKDTNEPPYVTTHADYLSFLVDSQHVYKAMEDIVHQHDILIPFRNTGLERVIPLEKDILYMIQEYNLQRPSVGQPGHDYSILLYELSKNHNIPAFICHYYNFYFAHTAGGRMIGKQISSLLLNKKTLEFYKWDKDLNEIKNAVKDNIEKLASTWSIQEKKECVDATEAAFQIGGAINLYLSGKVV